MDLLEGHHPAQTGAQHRSFAVIPSGMFAGLPMCSAAMIMADPPWKFQHRSKKGITSRAPEFHYACMPLDDIKAMPVKTLAASNCLLWLWVTNPMLPQGLDVLAAWGFRYVTHGVWHKRTLNGCTAFGTGYVLRSAHETFLIGKIGKPRTTRSVRSLFEGQVLPGKPGTDGLSGHSRKPHEAYAVAEALMPNRLRIELFSRTDRPGWLAWGDETGKFNGEAT